MWVGDDGPSAAGNAVHGGMSVPATALANIRRGLGHETAHRPGGCESAPIRADKITIAPLSIDKAERLLNNIRKRNGSGPVRLLPSLQEAAAEHAAAMARRGRLAHDFGPGTSLRDRLAGVEPHLMAAENVGAGYSSIESVLKGWMASRGHWRNMADSRLTRFGLAQAINPGSRNRNYWALILIRPNLA